MANQAKSSNRSFRASPVLSRFLSATDGGLLPIIAGSITMLVGFTGLAVDGARLYYAKDVLQKSLDAAGLAAGHTKDPDDMAADAQAFFDANFQAAGNYIQQATLSIEVAEDDRSITLSANAVVDATFMRLFGFSDLNLRASTEITRETRGMELALVMDNTGSMGGSKITAMRNAAHSMIDIVYGSEEAYPNLYVSLIPYTATINIGPQHKTWLTPASQALVDDATKYAAGATSWKGCVMARDFGEDQTDTPPSADFEAFYWEPTVMTGTTTNSNGETIPLPYDNFWIDPFTGDYDLREAQNNGNKSRGPNLGCGPAITPLIASRTSVKLAIDEMAPWSRGGTTSSLGLVWGWRTLSPKWRGFWIGGDRPSDLPLDYEVEYMDKVAVVLTDGQNQLYDWGGDGPTGSDWTSYGRANDLADAAGQSALNEINDRFKATCASMKEEGIIIYAITFGSTPNSTTQDMFRNCASNPAFYFHAPENADLSTTFETIGRQLSNLRLSK